MSISRKCVPFTPFDGELAKSTVALVTAGGVHLKEQDGFNIADELGDLTYRIIPVDVLRALQQEGFIRGIARKHVGYMGYTMQLKAMYEGTAREIANEIDKGSRADAVILTGG